MADETEFEIMDADDQSRTEDSFMLFHECPWCSCRRNCSESECSCCDEVVEVDNFCKYQEKSKCLNREYTQCADSFERAVLVVLGVIDTYKGEPNGY